MNANVSPMTNPQQEQTGHIMYNGLLTQLVREFALDVRDEGEEPFILSNGDTSRFYLDCRRLCLSSSGLNLVVNMISDKLSDYIFGPSNVDAIGGPSIGADPIVGGLLYKLGCMTSRGSMNGFLIRKKPKTYGKEGRVVGSVRPGDRCILIEDVANTGQSALDAIDELEKFGCTVEVALCVVDRLQGAADKFEKRGIPFHSLLTIKDLV